MCIWFLPSGGGVVCPKAARTSQMTLSEISFSLQTMTEEGEVPYADGLASTAHMRTDFLCCS